MWLPPRETTILGAADIPGEQNGHICSAQLKIVNNQQSPERRISAHGLWSAGMRALPALFLVLHPGDDVRLAERCHRWRQTDPGPSRSNRFCRTLLQASGTMHTGFQQSRSLPVRALTIRSQAGIRRDARGLGACRRSPSRCRAVATAVRPRAARQAGPMSPGRHGQFLARDLGRDSLKRAGSPRSRT
jgi:hypothetical protein